MDQKAAYAKKLRDPRWQKKRLEILNRDGWRCVWCWEEKETLHVHHFSYTANPWDSPNEELITLCEFCHDSEQDRDYFEDEMVRASKHLPLNILASIAASLQEIRKDPEILKLVICYFQGCATVDEPQSRIVVDFVKAEDEAEQASIQEFLAARSTA